MFIETYKSQWAGLCNPEITYNVANALNYHVEIAGAIGILVIL